MLFFPFCTIFCTGLVGVNKNFAELRGPIGNASDLN